MLNVFLVCYLVLSLVYISKCEVFLRIFRNVEAPHLLNQSKINLQEGMQLSLICNLTSTNLSDINQIPGEHLIWGKSKRFYTNNDLLNILTNKSDSSVPHDQHYTLLPTIYGRAQAILQIDYFSAYNSGQYFCISTKHNLVKVVYVSARQSAAKNSIVNMSYIDNYDGNRKAIATRGKSIRDSVKEKLDKLNILLGNTVEAVVIPRDGSTYYCSDSMFKCMSNGACITQHYVCDGRADCKDGSDESPEKCGDDPCKDKLHCDDGRCIPHAWCCDRLYHSDCTVTFRPTCCLVMGVDSYGDYEAMHNVSFDLTHIKTGGTRYLLIFLCILATFFSVVLMLLILSKVLMFAKKSAASSPTNCPHLHHHYRRRCHFSNRHEYTMPQNDVMPPHDTMLPPYAGTTTLLTNQPGDTENPQSRRHGNNFFRSLFSGSSTSRTTAPASAIRSGSSSRVIYNRDMDYRARQPLFVAWPTRDCFPFPPPTMLSETDEVDNPPPYSEVVPNSDSIIIRTSTISADGNSCGDVGGVSDGGDAGSTFGCHGSSTIDADDPPPPYRSTEFLNSTSTVPTDNGVVG